jgi:tetratricopeptide (TPR) repeat protein
MKIFANFYYHRGMTKEHMSNYDGAIADFTKAIELDPKNAEIYRERSELRRLTHDYDGAMSDLDKAANLGQN